MGLSGDFKEATTNWKDKSFTFKTISIFTVFLAISSITSLADIIIQWKGFIKDGLDFYTQNITGVVRDFMTSVGMKYTQPAIDIIIIYGLIVSSLIRFNIANYKLKVISKKGMLFYVVTNLIVYLFIVFKYSNKTIQSFTFSDFWLEISFFIIILIASFKIPKYREVVFTPLLALLIVMILAAINKGLIA